MVPVNYLAIVACAVVAMVLGYLWYGPIFGKEWMRLMGMHGGSMGGGKNMGMLYGIQFVGALLMAFVTAHALIFASAFLHESGTSAGLMTGFFNWLGFVAPTTIGMVLWEGKSWKLWAIVAGYWLLTLCTMGVILSLWPASLGM
jgi:hypothetical protein